MKSQLQVGWDGYRAARQVLQQMIKEAYPVGECVVAKVGRSVFEMEVTAHGFDPTLIGTNRITGKVRRVHITNIISD